MKHSVSLLSLFAVFFITASVLPCSVVYAADETAGGKVTIEVKDADIRNVLDAFSKQTGLSVVAGQDVTATVTMRLIDVSWDEALDVILRPYGFGYERKGNIIIVSPIEKLRALEEAQPLSTRVFTLKYLDAQDIKPIIESQLSPRGKVAILESTSQTGWDFIGEKKSGGYSGGQGAVQFGKRQRKEGKQSRAKQFVVSDIPPVFDAIDRILVDLDEKPQQIIIEARFMEVNTDRLKDIGFDYATGSTGTSAAAVTGVEVDENSAGSTISTAGGQFVSGLVKPSVFDPKQTTVSGINPYNTGLSFRFQHLTGAEFDVVIHALEEDAFTNTLSAPRIMTLNNQEASILVGTQYPILTSNVTGTTSTTTTTSLDYYQDIGIQLNVVPQINDDGHINMIIHPGVTSFSTTLEARSPEGTVLAEYPIITTREAETKILMKDGDTIMIGGLMKDVNSEGKIKVPLLGDIPLLGLLFQRKTNDMQKVELLIFITAHIVTDDSYIADMTPRFVTAEERDKDFHSSDWIEWKEKKE